MSFASFVSGMAAVQRPLFRTVAQLPQAPAVVLESFKQHSSFVSDRGTDLCVCCRADTGIPSHQDIAMRPLYVEGVGQHCRRCF